MGKTRVELHIELVKLLTSNNVYYQPPESLQMQYPAIVYFLAKIDNVHANNDVYHQKKPYQVILIDENPDSDFIEPLSRFPYSSMGKPYQSDNLNHFPFTIYY